VSVASLILLLKVATYQRCDRILWKTTVIPEPVPANEVVQDSAARPQTRGIQFLAHAFWPSPLSDSSAPKHLASSYVVSGKLDARITSMLWLNHI